jgi:hypothetical protein
MESQQTHDSPSSTVLEALRTMNEFASIPPDSSGYVKQAAADAASTRFLGFERTPLNILFGKTIIVAFFAQFVLFYTIWWLSPSFTKNRRGLAWVLTLCSACWILFNTTFELGYLRTPLWSYLGWEQSGGVGLDGATTAAGNIFSYWLPSFHAWVLHLGADSQTTLVQDMTLENLLSALSSAESVKILLFDQSTITALAGKYLRWLVSLPIFSLAPLNPPVTMSKTAPYFLGGGGRLLISVENFPRETVWSSLVCGYFLAYCAADLVLGLIHYPEHIDPASGYMHHFFYTWLLWQLGRHDQLSMFMICGGVLEGMPSLTYLCISCSFFTFVCMGNFFFEGRGKENGEILACRCFFAKRRKRYDSTFTLLFTRCFLFSLPCFFISLPLVHFFFLDRSLSWYDFCGQ